MAFAGWTRTETLLRYTRARAPERAAKEAARGSTLNNGAALGMPDTIGHGEPARGCSE